MNLPSRPPHLDLEAEQSNLPTVWSPPNNRFGPRQPMTPPAEDPVFQSDLVRDLIGFPWRAVKRHRTLSISLFLLISMAAGLSTIVMPRHYLVYMVMVAAKNNIMPALGNPRRAVPSESDAPTRLAVEAVMRRDNLMEIIRETNLMAIQEKLRSPLGKLSAFVTERVLGKHPTQDDRLKMVVGLLESRMYVRPDEQGTVTIGVDWPDPVSAVSLVQAAQQNFIEQRHEKEISMIGESISILEGHVTQAQQQMQEALLALKAARPDIEVNDGLRPAPAAAPRKQVSPATQAEIASVRSTLTTKQRLISDLEQSRSQTLATLQTKLSDLTHKFGTAHPEVTSTEDRIRALQTDSPQLVSLRAEETALENRLAALGAEVDNVTNSQPFTDPSFTRQMLERLTRARSDSAASPQVAYAQSRLKMATNDYEDYLDRLENAKIELETSRAAFKYRFTVVTPAEQPKKPFKPKIPLLIGGGIFLGLMFGVFAATVLDFLSGRVVEKWQVQRQIGLPILATIPTEPWR
jgi:uncharacterized protein involved in exopolysaccharide biosynthesis